MKSSCKIVLLIMAVVGSAWSQPKEYFTIARIKYGGGGDWYNDPSILPNLLQFLRDNTTVEARTEEDQVSPGDDQLYSCPLLFLTGHGRIFFSQSEAERLRSYLANGGFLYADDDYGMDEHFRREIKKVFPDKEMVELPFSHPIYHVFYDFPNGLPKIHEHDGGPPQGFWCFHYGKMGGFFFFYIPIFRRVGRMGTSTAIRRT